MTEVAQAQPQADPAAQPQAAAYTPPFPPESVQQAAPAAPATPPVPKPPKIENNGVTRPADPSSKTGRVWAISDELSKALGKPVPRTDVMKKGAEEGINPATIATQYGKWRVFNGLKGVLQERPAKPEKAPKVPKGQKTNDVTIEAAPGAAPAAVQTPAAAAA